MSTVTERSLARYPCGYVTWCRYCHEVVWSGSSDVAYAVDATPGGFYYHEGCGMDYQLRMGELNKLDGKKNGRWTIKVEQPPKPAVYTVAEFRALWGRVKDRRAQQPPWE